MTRDARARAAILIAAALFSTGGTVIKLLTLDAWQIAGWRAVVAAAVLWCVFPAARGRFSATVFGVATAYAATFLLFVHANQMTTAASAILLESAAPLYIVVLAPLLLGEPVERRDLWLLLILCVGLCAFFYDPDPVAVTAPTPLLGNVLGAVAGFTWACALVGLRWLGQRPAASAKGSSLGRSVGSATGDSATMVACVIAGNLLVFAVCLPFLGPLTAIGGGVVSVPAESTAVRNLLGVCYLGAVQVGLAYVFLVPGLHRVPAFSASILLLLEPLLSPIWAWWAHRERLGFGTLFGGAVLLLAIVLQWRKR